MEYQIKSKRNSQGFTLIELMVVIAIIILFARVTDSVFVSFGSHSNLELGTDSFVEALRYAKRNSEQVQGDSKWGVKLLKDQIVVFKGESYATRNNQSDQALPLPRGVTAETLSETVFEKVTGFTTAIGTTTLSIGNKDKDIFVNAKGTITY
jgi:Tfp pilus assembly protein FimT